MNNKTLNNKRAALLPYILFIAAAAAMALLLTRGSFLYGSTLDWNSQDFRIPEYFRTMFYHSENIFQSFDMNTGAGQDIYNLAYYGYLSPVILFSYLLPFVSMKTYIICASLVCLTASACLLYSWLAAKYSLRTAFLCAIVLELASPMMLQSHRHTMFIMYMPFLILALIGIEKYVRCGRRLQLILCTFLTIMCNFFFAASACAVIGLFAVYTIMTEMEDSSARAKITCLLRTFLNACVAVLSSMILLLPVISLLFSGRHASHVHYSIYELFIPHTGSILFGTQYIVLDVLVLAGAVFGIVTGKKGLRYLGIVFVMFACFPVLTMLLNGMMYMDCKIMIPFIPMAMIPAAEFIEFTAEEKVRSRIASGIIIAAVIFSSLMINLNDELVPAHSRSAADNAAAKRLTRVLLDSDDSAFRISNTAVRDNYNQIYYAGQMTDSIYSSLENMDYSRVWFNSFYNNVKYRNSSMIKSSSNIIFNTFIGNKYIISKSSSLPGCIKKDTIGSLSVFENKTAFPLGFVMHRYIDSSSYQRLAKQDRTLALLTCAVTDSSDKDFRKCNDYDSHIPLLSSSRYSIGDRQISRAFADGSTLRFSRSTTTFLHVDSGAGDLLLLSFNVTNKNSSAKSSGLGTSAGSGGNDVKIKIAGLKNKLTDPASRYSNGNTCFEYVIPASSSGTYEMKFSRGRYRVSGLKVSAVSSDVLRNARDSLEAMNDIHISRSGTGITGTVTSSRSGYFVATIPWSKNFTVYVDGRKADCYKTDLAFLGFHIDSGKHNIKIEYRNKSQLAGGIMSIAGLACFAALLVYDRRKEKSWKKQL